jgi:hypothetical protein
VEWLSHCGPVAAAATAAAAAAALLRQQCLAGGLVLSMYVLLVPLSTSAFTSKAATHFNIWFALLVSLLLLQGVNILPTVIQLQSNARVNAFEQPTATPDSDLPGELMYL